MNNAAHFVGPLSQRCMDPVAIIGAGTVGMSWAALFISYGRPVKIYDPMPGLHDEAMEYLCAIKSKPSLPSSADLPEVVSICDSIETALDGVCFVQESIQENLQAKRDLLRKIDELVPAHVIVGSSTSSLLLADIVAECRVAPTRFVLGHPFNPPHLMPLVEVFGTCQSSVQAAIAVYRSVGRHPITMRKQLPGHVANRLTSAIFREAVWLLKEGVASVEDIDAAMCQGPGIRFAHMGPFQTYHLAAGNGGIRQYLEHLGPSQEARWKSLGDTPTLDKDTNQQIVRGVEQMVGSRSIASLAASRDAMLVAILNAKANL